jgi:hypothetical protein
LLDEIWLSIVLHVPFFREADSETYHHMGATIVKEILAVIKYKAQNFDV